MYPASLSASLPLSLSASFPPHILVTLEVYAARLFLSLTLLPSMDVIMERLDVFRGKTGRVSNPVFSVCSLQSHECLIGSFLKYFKLRDSQ